MSAQVSTDVDRALEVLRNGGLVAIPTETVYGLAGDASNEIAVRRIFAVKGRPGDHPLIVHVADADQLGQWCAGPPPLAAVTLAESCWPGPLTVLVSRAEHVLSSVTGGRSTVGVRVPAHDLTSSLLQRFTGGLAAPSANRFGRVSPTCAAHVVADLGGDIDLVLDGGPCPIGVESTIVDCSTSPPQLLRPGAISFEQVEALLDRGLAPTDGASRAPGMLASHYAPRCRVVLAESAHSALSLAATFERPRIIGADIDPVDYAHHLYRWLREADEAGIATVIAVLPPASGLGHAIRDRLVKAAAPDATRRAD
jgi:L-threonylcarbamoyladenylate synthase